MVLDSGSLSKYKEQEIAEIKRLRVRRVRNRLIFSFFVVLFFALLYSNWTRNLLHKETELEDVEIDAETQLDELFDQSEIQSDWLRRRATRIELEAYSFLEGLILDEDAYFEEGKGQALFSNFNLELKSIGLRLCFYVVASFRIWILAAILGLIIGFRQLKPYTEPDILGLTGNRRLFFSGVRASLMGSGTGADLFVPGLACPRTCSEKELKESELGKLLEKLGAANKVNNYLASVVLRHKNYPAFLGAAGEENTLEAFVEPIGLEKNTCLLLKAVTELHEEFGSHAEEVSNEEVEINNPSENGRMNLVVYGKFVKNNLRRVLPQSFKDAIVRMTTAELAALVLAMEAGKSLAFKKEKAGFVKSSVFPHLSSRAVLHSAPGFSDCFDSPARERLRRAITYASRYNNFGLVRLPVDLELATRACRQWTELMLACPNELQVVSDEVELFGIISLANLNFARIFIEGIASLRHFENAEAYTSGTNLLLFPIKKLIEILHQAIDSSTLRRLDELVYLVSQKQILQDMSVGFKREEELPGSPFRILRPIPLSDIKQLAELHDISIDVLKDWSSLRVILSSFSWLARRVGNSSVPDSSLVLALMRSQGISPSSEGSIMSQKGMVPLRGSRLRQHFGPSWQKHFIYVDAVTMAESNEDLSRLMGLGARAFLDEENDLGDLEKE